MLMWWKSAVNRSFFLSLATFRMRSSACDTLIRLCARHVLCWSAFPLVSALGSTGSAMAGSAADCSTAGRATLFAGFAATMTESDFSCPCIIGYGSSPSRCGPPYSAPLDDGGQTRDIPGSGAILLHVMWPLSPAGRQHLACRCRTCCLRANENSRPLRCLIFRGSIPHPTQLLCTLRDHCRQGSRNTRYQAGAAPYLGRSSTGWIAPACLAHSFDHLVSAWRSDSGIAGPSALGMVRSMTSSAGCLCGMHSPLSARRPAPFAEPGAVIRHLRALRRRRVPLARRRLGAVVGCAPAQLDAVVQVVRHLEIRGAVEHVLERQRPGGAIAARIRKLARRKLRREHALQFRLHVRDGLPLRHRIALGPTHDAIRERAHHVDRDQQTQVARRCREILPRAGRLEDRRAVRHLGVATPAGLEFAPVLDRRHARLDLLFQ